MADDAFSVTMAVRFRDIDVLGHVNNAVYATYLEHARSRYFHEVVGEPLSDSVLVHLSIDFRVPIDIDDETVEVSIRVPRLGESSIPMEYEIRAGDAVAATAESVQVAIDAESGESVPLPAAWRTAIEADMGL